MNSDFININYIIDKKLNSRSFNPENYVSQVISDVLETSSFLYESYFPLSYYNNIEENVFSEDGNYLVSGGYKRSHPELAIWKLVDGLFLGGNFSVLQSARRSKVNYVRISRDNSRIYSSGSDKFLVTHDTVTGYIIDRKPFYCCIGDISNHPYNINLAALCCPKKGLNLYDLKSRHLEKVDTESDNIECVQFHPTKSYLLLIVSNDKNVLYTYDLRNRKNVFTYKSNKKKLDVSYARYNKYGDQIIALRNYSLPTLFNSNETYPFCEFNEMNYLHKKTNLNLPRKNCCFAGYNDEYIIVPSDSFDIFWWKIPKRKSLEKKTIKVNSAKFILRSSTYKYKVTYNYKKTTLICSGIGRNSLFYSPFRFRTYLKKKKEVDILELNEKLKKKLSRHNLVKNQFKTNYVYDFNLIKLFIFFVLFIYSDFLCYDLEYTEELKLNKNAFNEWKTINFSYEFIEDFNLKNKSLIKLNIEKIENKLEEEFKFINFLFKGSNFYSTSQNEFEKRLNIFDNDFNVLKRNDDLLQTYISWLQIKIIKLKLIEQEIINEKDSILQFFGNMIEKKNFDLKVIRNELLEQNFNLIDQLFNENFFKVIINENFKTNLLNLNIKELSSQSNLVNEKQKNLFEIKKNISSEVKQNISFEIKKNISSEVKQNISFEIKKNISSEVKQKILKISKERNNSLIKENLMIIIENELNRQIDKKIKKFDKIKSHLKSILHELLKWYLRNRKLFFNYKSTVLKLRKKKSRPDIYLPDFNQHLSDNLLEKNIEIKRYYDMKEINYFAKKEIILLDEKILNFNISTEEEYKNLILNKTSCEHLNCEVSKKFNEVFNCTFCLKFELFN